MSFSDDLGRFARTPEKRFDLAKIMRFFWAQVMFKVTERLPSSETARFGSNGANPFGNRSLFPDFPARSANERRSKGNISLVGAGPGAKATLEVVVGRDLAAPRSYTPISLFGALGREGQFWVLRKCPFSKTYTMSPF